MNIIYLHGLMSNNQSPKTDWLKQEHIIHNPQLKYHDSPELIFSELDSYCENNEVDLIIGSSMGGFLAYNLGNKYNVPTLLFNPALAQNKKVKPIVEKVDNENLLHTIVLGENDDVIIPLETLKFLNDNKSNFIYQFEAFGHRTPIEVFKKHFNKIVRNNKTVSVVK